MCWGSNKTVAQEPTKQVEMISVPKETLALALREIGTDFTERTGCGGRVVNQIAYDAEREARMAIRELLERAV